MTDSDAVKNVFEQGAMYDAVVRNNYMRHAELASAMAAWARSFRRPMRVVDLGCGDAGLAVRGFGAANVERYLGVDLAESSIERARHRLAIWPGRVELACGNFSETLHRLPDQSANVALASYSLHHFSTNDKLKLILEIWRLLEPRGAFLWIDVVRNDGESREEYIDRITHAMTHDWAGLTPEQRQLGVDHVRQSDFPEPRSWMLEHVAAAGFSLGDALFQDEYFAARAFIKEWDGCVCGYVLFKDRIGEHANQTLPIMIEELVPVGRQGRDCNVTDDRMTCRSPITPSQGLKTARLAGRSNSPQAHVSGGRRQELRGPGTDR